MAARNRKVFRSPKAIVLYVLIAVLTVLQLVRGDKSYPTLIEYVQDKFNIGIRAVESTSRIGGTARVIDGDTLDVGGVRVRLHGIDAPESSQACQRPNGSAWRCGQEAALALRDHIGRQVVSCSQRDVDRYGRVVAQCFIDGADINGWLIANGWAVAYRQYSSDYIDEERTAKFGKVGIWAGAFDMPWDWRRGERLAAASSNNTDDCRVKGNISPQSGERIYHVPGGKHYSSTQIDTANGERWFCSEEEAQKAGWRRSRR